MKISRYIFVVAGGFIAAACGAPGSREHHDRAPAVSEAGGPITVDTTWEVSDCPVVVASDIYVEGSAGPVLTIQAGCEVRFRAATGLYVGFYGQPGGLQILGTNDHPVLLTTDGTPSPGAWSGIGLYASADPEHTSLSHAQVEYAGGYFLKGALHLDDATARVVHSAFRHSAQHGLWLENDAALTADSEDLHAIHNEAYGASVEAGAVHTLPAGSLEDNQTGAVQVRGGDVQVNATWPVRSSGVDYVITGDIYVEGTSEPTLTLAAGSVLQFAEGAGLYVGYSLPGALHAAGTVQAPVSLAPRSAVHPWSGVALWSEAIDQNTILEHAHIEGGGGFFLSGNLHLHGASPTLEHVKLSRSHAYGLYIDCTSGAVDLDLTTVSFGEGQGANVSGDIGTLGCH